MRTRRSLVVLTLIGFGAGCEKKSERPAPAPTLSPAKATTSVAGKQKPAAGAPQGFSLFAKPAFAYAKGGGPKQVSLSDIAERAVRSVVNVRSSKAVEQRRHPMHGHPFFDRPRRGTPFGQPRQRRARSLGSGVIVSADGIVITNHHVVRHADDIRVTLANDQEYGAKLVGSDPKSDVAVLRLQNPPTDLQPLSFGDSKALRLGEVVLAIGNPFGIGKTVTMGIVSAVGRANMGIVDYEDFIQTDAAINPGNSGGALVDMRGKLVGINTAILSRSGGNQGVGFAIPAAMVKPIMESLLEHGRVVRGWLGVMIQNLDKRLATAMGLKLAHGVLVAGVQEHSPAARSGLKRGDVIIAVDSRPVKDVARLRNAIAVAGPGRQVKLAVVRGAAKLEVAVALGELPGQKVARIDRGQGSLGGLTVETLDEARRQKLRLPRGLRGVVVKSIEARSAAAAAGLGQGDVVMEINRRPISNTAQFSQLYRSSKGALLLLVFREGNTLYLLLER